MKPNVLMILFLLICCAFSGKAFSQSTPGAAEGTYQYIFRSPDFDKGYVLTQQELVAIDSVRHSEKTVCVRFSDHFVIKVLPDNVISAPNFSAPAERIYINQEINHEELFYEIEQAIRL